MKRIAIFQLLVISCFNLLAQIRPTQREINNFDSGDVFHSTYWLNAGPPNYIKRYFLSNKISKQDTIQYLVIDTTISYVAPMIWEQKVKQYYLSYTQLDEVPGSKSWMYIHEDTFGLMNCNDTFFSKTLCDFSGHDSGNVSQGSCTTYIFAKGLGLYTLYSSHGGGPGSQQYFKIDYYKKVNKECGKRLNAGVSHLFENKNNIEIYPNPANQVIYLNTQVQGEYEIYTNYGKLIQSEKLREEINIENLVPGIYYLRIYNGNSFRVIRFAKKQ